MKTLILTLENAEILARGLLEDLKQVKELDANENTVTKVHLVSDGKCIKVEYFKEPAQSLKQ